MWADSSVFYQIYPLGFCGAPLDNDGILEHRIKKVEDWIPHFTKLGIDAIYFSPIFDSDRHGYDTRDFQKIDIRLGDNADFAELCKKLHEVGIKVVLDGVFNHVGRGFFAFQDVLKYRHESRYRDWFHISFEGNSNYNDGLWYEGWEGHYELVKLNLRNPEVVKYLLDSVSLWIQDFDIDGIRLDVAYCLDHDFMRTLRWHCDQKKPEFFLMGEMIHGNYNTIVNDGMLHSATNYDCYKGLYSAFNSMNMFEIAHSLNRQFGIQGDGLYRGKNLLSFVDNHDVTRIASMLQNPNHLNLIYALEFGMPGIPSVYYGSEWGAEGRKEWGDPALRLSYDHPEWNDHCDFIAKLAKAKKNSEALCFGDYHNIVLTNHQLIFQRKSQNQRVLVAINAADYSYDAHFNAGCGTAVDLITGENHDFGGGSTLPPYSAQYWLLEC